MSRSRFYVDTPEGLGDLPGQRHSMYAGGIPPSPDPSTTSSSATLPSAAGSVDRLNEKKSRGFFTLRPKGLRPFFSSTSLSSIGKKSRRCDSACQTDERPLGSDVGVQTLPPAPTADVPVQTSCPWEEEGRRRLMPYRSAFEPGRLLKYSTGYPTHSAAEAAAAAAVPTHSDPAKPQSAPPQPPSYRLYRPVSPKKSSDDPLPKNDVQQKSSNESIASGCPSPPPDRPPSALKVERTDSPKISKSVHFVLSETKPSKKEDIPTKKEEVKPLDPRNLDKDFEALLRNLDIITDDPPEEEPPVPIKSPLTPLLDCPPKQTLLSTNLRSAFDSLNHEVLPAILENADEVSEIDVEPTNRSDDSNTCEPAVDELEKNEPPTPKGEAETFTSSVVFTASKLDTGREPENVYDSGISKSTLKTVLLPTLPSFFEAPSRSSVAVEDRVESEDVASLEQAAADSDNMLSRSSSRSSMRSNSSRAEFMDLTKKFDSCENLDQLEDEIMRSLCTPSEELFDSAVMGPDLPNDRNSDPSQLRRVILDRLLSGESVREIVPNESNVPAQLAEAKAKPIVKTKYIATITKFEPPNDIPSDSSEQHIPYASFKTTKAAASTNTPRSSPTPVLFFPTNNSPSKNNSVFLLPETNTLSAGEPSSIQPDAPSGAKPVASSCDFSPSRLLQNNEQILATPPPSQSEKQKTNGQCDYASCLRPSQVQNSTFTVELSELTANKSYPERAKSPRFGAPARAALTRIIANEDSEGVSEDQSDQEMKHKSELTITLKPIPTKDTNSCVPEESHQPAEERSIPPPPPPPPSSNQSTWIPTSPDSLESRIKTQHSNLTKPQDGRPDVAAKSAMMAELEKRLESPRRHSCDGPYGNNKVDSSSDVRSETDADRSPVQGLQNNSSNSYVNHSPVSAAPFKCNGSNGFSVDNRERSSSLPNGKHENGLYKNDLPYSSKTIITDAPPPPGAVLIDKKITVEGDNVHTDKYYAIPIREFTNEKTTTTKFVPAPPKYEGIGPTEDGVPIGLRNSVKKENMHDWYKTMYKSLHKADSDHDIQEYVIGYSSEPESTKTERIMKKKSATLDNRSVHNSSRNHGSLQDYHPPSAKSSIEVYRIKPRLIEDYEPGHSSVTDDEISYGSTRYLPPLNTPKPSYEFKNGYEQENNFIRNLEKPDSIHPEEQKIWYKDIQKGGDIPQFGLQKPEPEKLKEPVIGPLPPPPLNYNGPTTVQASRPLTLPANYNNFSDSQQLNGSFEVHMRQAIHTELQQRISPLPSQLSSPTRSILKSPTRSPDLKMPARALFDFKAESPKEIALKKGDLVMILRQLDKNWYEGEYKGTIGIFPISYVEIIPPEQILTPSKPIIEGHGRAMFDFTAKTSVELSLRKGDAVSILRRVDSNWYEARFNNRKGIVPINYLKVLQEPQEQRTYSPKPSSKSPMLLSPGSINSSFNANSKPSSPSSLSVSSPVDSNKNKYQPRSKKGSNLIEPVMYKAIYSYSPQNSDELELLEGDIVCVVEMCDDGWYVGTSVRTGVFGIFPGNYVERI